MGTTGGDFLRPPLGYWLADEIRKIAAGLK